jgi:integrase/recombinase XerD
MKRKDFKKYDLTPLDDKPLEGVTASIILDLRSEKDKGYFPVKYRVTFDRKQVYYPCMDLSMDEFSRLHGSVRDLLLIKTKKLITDGFKRITDAIEELIQKEGFTLEGLARRLKRGTGDSILDAFKNKIEDLEKEGKIGTSVWYSCAKNSIEKFTSKDLKFSDITVNWLNSYQAYLLKEVEIKGKTKTKKKTTVSMYMRALRSIINKGKADGIISQAQYPFMQKKNGKYSIPKGSGRKIALSETQLSEVFDYPILPNDEKWRDLWVFSFYCNGANINDILRFKYKDIVSDIIEWERQKTKDTSVDDEKIRAYINDEMKRIIVRWGNPDHKTDNYIFDYLKSGMTPIQERMVIQNVTHTINKKMKKIGRALEFGDVTTYWARHSWASISRRKGTSVFVISKGLGHKNISTTDDYLASISIDELKENADKLPRRQK